jgi:hypothetical protein
VQLGQLRTGELTEHGSGHPLLDEHPVDGPQPDRGQGGERQVGVVASAHVEDLTVDGGIPNRPGPDRAEKLQRGQGIDQVPVPLLPDARCGVRVRSEAQHSHWCVKTDLQKLTRAFASSNTISYRYDFADCWDHSIRREHAISSTARPTRCAWPEGATHPWRTGPVVRNPPPSTETRSTVGWPGPTRPPIPLTDSSSARPRALRRAPHGGSQAAHASHARQSGAGSGYSRVCSVGTQHHADFGDPLFPHHLAQRGDERRGLVDHPALKRRRRAFAPPSDPPCATWGLNTVEVVRQLI